MFVLVYWLCAITSTKQRRHRKFAQRVGMSLYVSALYGKIHGNVFFCCILGSIKIFVVFGDVGNVGGVGG